MIVVYIQTIETRSIGSARPDDYDIGQSVCAESDSPADVETKSGHREINAVGAGSNRHRLWITENVTGERRIYGVAPRPHASECVVPIGVGHG